ncbi:MAG TPA: DUF1553 domain-containing protein, partial [Planctomycetaceae bacterium]|nr:DUF1553 domain-containing protein [Planctomycetaceae bacterium]
DVWRYSDWYGRRQSNEIRYSQYHIWRWRDWIIESLNAGKGYDRMLVEMLAGDELAPDDPDVLRATGYLARNWYKFNRNSWLQETVEHTGLGFLGLTLKCARCHDHKFDPLPQEDFYRFRAFFEPHDVRTDRVSGEPDVIMDGLARVFDKDAAAVTYLFERGDDRRPDQSRPLAPGVPAALGGAGLDVAPVELPVTAYYPALHHSAVAAVVAAAASQVQMAESARSQADGEVEAATRRLEQFTSSAAADEPVQPFLVDDFRARRPETWRTIRGRWDYREGRLVQSEVAHFASLVTLSEHPPDFKARLRYRTSDGGVYRSVGVFFDMVDERDAQAVYTSVGDARQAVQAFHRQAGSETYPAEGIRPAALERHADIVLEITVRGQQLEVTLNGEPKLDYRMPLPRQRGRFAIWNHSGTAEFFEIQIEPLVPSRTDAEAAHRRAIAAAAQAEKKLAVARAEFESVRARVAAERAKYGLTPGSDVAALARAAARAERVVGLAKAEDGLLAAEQESAVAREAAAASSTAPANALTDAGQKLAAARQALEAARQALAGAGDQYEPLGPTYPAKSTGRRLALARWMIDRQNPRTARVAVNHIWRRHFGRALVETVNDFGPRSKGPSHPELLDWLAAELMEHGWNMKHVHRLIVTSSAYRTTSAAGAGSDTNAALDPDNRLVWRTNRQRMQAEIVRDGLLHLSGRLDATFGGPDLDEALGETSGRRSLYFRTTPDNSMEFLDLFDLANPNECYERRESVVPQQALALSNSALAQTSARLLARELSDETPEADAFITAAFEQVLTRRPTADELAACRAFLDGHAELLRGPANLTAYSPAPVAALPPSGDAALRARENLVQVLFNH